MSLPPVIAMTFTFGNSRRNVDGLQAILIGHENVHNDQVGRG
jgi:hypothetical protein